MKDKIAVFVVLLSSVSVVTYAQQQSQLCQQVILPTEEQASSDYRRIQSFMFVHSADEYDRLKRLDSASRAAQASYKFFGAEYDESTSREEFIEKIRHRLQFENFNLSESEARSYARRGLTDAQVAAWASCVEQVSGAGGFLLAARNVTGSGFTLVITRVLPHGISTASADIDVTGGYVNQGGEKRKSISRNFGGSGSVAYEVSKDRDSREVRISGTLMEAFPDSLLVDFTPLPPPRQREELVLKASQIVPGGYVKYDRAQGMIVSGDPAGGPSENYSIQVDVRRAGTYAIDAM